MEQINLEQVCAPECVKSTICLENIPEEEVKVEWERNINEKVKNSISKLIKKAELNAKYFNELRDIKLVRAQTPYRQYGIF